MNGDPQFLTHDSEAADRLVDAMLEFLRGGPVPIPPPADPPPAPTDRLPVAFGSTE